MKKLVVVSVTVVSLAVMAVPGFCEAKKADKVDGKAKFDQHCAVCHPKGGNIIKSDKPLSKKSLAAHGIKSEKDIVAKMRNPGPSMTKFDAKTVPEAEATAIAKYILATFK
jgi:cytochrome c6